MPPHTTFPVDLCTGDCPSKDHLFRLAFSLPLAKHNVILTYNGYKRALELYGNDSIILRAEKVGRFQRWVSENPELLEEFHGRALADGFNPAAGYADTNASTYSFYHPVDPRNNELTRTSQHPATIRHSYITILDSDDDDDNATAPVSTPQATRGNLFKNVDMPDAIKNMSGLLVPQRSDFAGTCVGNAELAQILAETLESVLNADERDAGAV
ncbi:hypothetical protein EDB81DRAFT_79387 [Dactylonectria macrodidyma]|uniref:Uncharacterized protein n=1 Tax=Dactylonectria macrodidyma TaxID=307937 RepID=A0A9P9EDR3_9HYPO|nr:hypothetical protein EDB81DRAFT_79387 [Dactylonectria macrodidyma]